MAPEEEARVRHPDILLIPHETCMDIRLVALQPSALFRAF